VTVPAKPNLVVRPQVVSLAVGAEVAAAADRMAALTTLLAQRRGV
jgi:hypothetical protein